MKYEVRKNAQDIGARLTFDGCIIHFLTNLFQIIRRATNRESFFHSLYTCWRKDILLKILLTFTGNRKGKGGLTTSPLEQSYEGIDSSLKKSQSSGHDANIQERSLFLKQEIVIPQKHLGEG